MTTAWAAVAVTGALFVAVEVTVLLVLMRSRGGRRQVASDLVSTMHARGSADAACMAIGLTSTTQADARPVTDDCWYYLVRAIDPCSATPDDTWGRNSLGVARPACR